MKSISTFPFIAALALAACGDAPETDPITYPDETLDADREEVSPRGSDDLYDGDEVRTADDRPDTGTDIVERDLPDIAGTDARLDDPAREALEQQTDDNIPPVSAQMEDGAVPGGPLTPGSWHDMDDRGVGFGAAQSEPIVAFRCATDSSELIVTLTGEIDGAETEPRGTVVSDHGTAVGYFRQAGAESPTIEMRVSATDPALRELSIGDRVAITREGADPVLITADPMLTDTLAECRD